ncbi:hypothetical protein K0B04_04130 [Patescibacteria group bacterium]|nr:hypothetical protein [Patescibacteria group bacterium]
MGTNKKGHKKDKFSFLKFLKQKNIKDILLLSLEILAIILLFYVVKIVNKANYTPTNWGRKPDIYYEYQAAEDISKGVNPYNKVLEGNMVWNRKYATLFPLYYYFLLGIISFSKFVFIDFYHNYGKVLYLFQFVAFIFTYLQFRKHDRKILGFAAGAFLVLNRWTIASVSSSKQDLIAIALIMASFYFMDKKIRLAYLLYGFSLGIKHLGIFFSPIYLLPLITKERKIKEFITDILIMSLPILIPSIPFMLDNFRSFFLSIMFSFTRTPESDTGVLYGYQKLLTLYNPKTYNNVSTFTLLLPRLPLVLFSILNIFMLFTRRIGKYAYVLFAIIIFISFNPVYFDQYLLWLTPFVFYSIVDYFPPMVKGKAHES